MSRYKNRIRTVSALFFAALLCFLASAVRADFTDVPSEHWAHGYILRAEEAGAVNGVGGGCFDPEARVTEAQFCAMLIRTFLPGELREAGPGEAWYAPVMEAALRIGLTESVNASFPEAELSRYQMAQIMANLMGNPSDAEATEAILASVPDGGEVPPEHRDAVAFAYGAGLLNGMDEAGSFRGILPMTRAQAAAVWCRLSDYICLSEYIKENGEAPPAGNGEDEMDSAKIETPSAILTVDGKEYRAGMPLDELTSLAGEPDEILEAFGDYRWYVFGTEDYGRAFFAAGIAEGRAVALCSAGTSFLCATEAGELSYGSGAEGLPRSGDAKTATFSGTADSAVFYLDANEGHIVHMVFLAEKQYAKVRYYADGFSVTQEECDGERRMLFHLTNAFRTAHGVRAFLWDEVPAKAAQNHAEDMAAQGYFSHTSADGRDLV